MKLSDYVAQFLAEKGVRHVFVYAGGASLHIIHSIAEHPGLTYSCCMHEQANGFAADGYARASGKVGVTVATSGPGATNLLTAVVGAFYDSVPCFFITGNQSSTRSSEGLGVRQYGFQETDIVAMARPVTKYAAKLEHPEMIAAKLNDAWYTMLEGRPGPVLLDIPDDFQRAEIDPSRLQCAKRPEPILGRGALGEKVQAALELIAAAKRPLLIAGAGCRGALPELHKINEATRIPIAPTWALRDVQFMRQTQPFGTHGTRAGNFMVQNADLIIAVGTRLDTHMTGDIRTFAREAKRIVVDIDSAELAKFEHFGWPVDLPICADASQFLRTLHDQCNIPPDKLWWKDTSLNELKAKFPTANTAPYRIMESIMESIPLNAQVFIDTGCTIAWAMQTNDRRHPTSRRLFHDWNNTAMGWALPAAIGGYYACPDKPIYCITGDGSLMMNLQELWTVVDKHLPINLIILDNQGHSMIKQTQDQWLGGKYYASSRKDLSFPNWQQLLHDISYDYLTGTSSKVFGLRPEERVVPQARFGRPIEDAEPLLPREEFRKHMIVKPLPVSE